MVLKMFPAQRILGVYLVGTGLLIAAVSALDPFTEQFEGLCDSEPPKVATNIDWAWLSSVEDWFLAGGSKSHLYWMTLQLFHNREDLYADIPEHQFYYDSCMKSNVSLSPETVSQLANLQGYGKSVNFNVEQIDRPEVRDFAIRIPGTDVTAFSRHHITLTDNRSFVFFTNCNRMGRRPSRKTWDVMSVTDTLGPEAIRMIEEHAEAQGFDKKHFVQLRHESCSSESKKPTQHSPVRLHYGEFGLKMAKRPQFGPAKGSLLEGEGRPRLGGGRGGWGSDVE